jgi:hypothetical protein
MAVNSDETNQASVREVIEVDRSFIIPVGTPLQIELGGVLAKLNSVSVGWFPEDYLIVKKPTAGFGPIASKLYRGNSVIIRYVSNGEVFAFQSEVLGSNDSPGLIFITYPTSVVRHNLRKHRRAPCYLSAELWAETDDAGLSVDPVAGAVTDLTPDGCAFEATARAGREHLPYFKVHDIVTLRIKFPGLNDETSLLGEVRRGNRDGNSLKLGIRFTKMEEHVENTIASYVSTNNEAR